MVLAVRFLPDDVIDMRRESFCKAAVLYAPDGSANVTISGGGGEGAVRADQRSGGLKQSATVSAQGGESSECDGGHDRTKSNASATYGGISPRTCGGKSASRPAVTPSRTLKWTMRMFKPNATFRVTDPAGRAMNPGGGAATKEISAPAL